MRCLDVTDSKSDSSDPLDGWCRWSKDSKFRRSDTVFLKSNGGFWPGSFRGRAGGDFRGPSSSFQRSSAPSFVNRSARTLTWSLAVMGV